MQTKISILFEIETPNDKLDLVRLRDNYGREGKPYEDSSYEFPKKDDCLSIETLEDTEINFCNCNLSLKKINTIDRRIERLRHEISAIQSDELHKISVEQAFMSDNYINIFKDLNLTLATMSINFGKVIKHERFITPNIICECVRVMRKFNEKKH